MNTIDRVLKVGNVDAEAATEYLKEFLIDSYFKDLGASEDQNGINNKVLNIFKIFSLKISEWQKLKRIPEALKQFTKQLIDPRLYHG